MRPVGSDPPAPTSAAIRLTDWSHIGAVSCYLRERSGSRQLSSFRRSAVISLVSCVGASAQRRSVDTVRRRFAQAEVRVLAPNLCALINSTREAFTPPFRTYIGAIRIAGYMIELKQTILYVPAQKMITCFDVAQLVADPVGRFVGLLHSILAVAPYLNSSTFALRIIFVSAIRVALAIFTDYPYHGCWRPEGLHQHLQVCALLSRG